MTTNTIDNFTIPTFQESTTPTIISTANKYLNAPKNADFNGDGYSDLVSFQPTNPSTNASSDTVGNILVSLGNGHGGFRTPSTVFTYNRGWWDNSDNSLDVGDFNSDGKSDLVFSESNKIYVLLNDGKGSFTDQPILVPAQYYAMSAKMGDLNGDGKADIVTVNDKGGSTSVFMGDGQGNFAPPITTTTVLGRGYSVNISDFNLDGKADLVNDHGYVLLGDGLGAFLTAVQVANVNMLNYPKVSDFNADGKSDVVFNSQVYNSVTNKYDYVTKVFLNTTAVTTPVVLPTTNTSHSGNATVTGNAQQNETLTTINTSATVLNLMPITSTSTSTTATPSNSTNSFPTPTMTLSDAYNPIPADINSDGKCDFILSSSIMTYSQKGHIYLNNGNGGFNNKSLFFDADVTLVDFNNDNLNDLLLSNYNGDAAASSSKSLYFSMNSNGAYFSLPTYLGSYSNSSMSGGDNYAIGDFNADGRPDVVTTSNDLNSNNNQLNVSIFINNGKNGFNTPVTSSYPSSYFSTIDSTADFNGDNRADLLINGHVFLSDGTGSFSQPIAVDSNTPTTGGYHIADFNGDGIADLYSGNYSNGSVLINDGTGHFNSIALNTNDIIKGAADFNGDGKADLIVDSSNQVTQKISTSIRIGDGNGRFDVSIPVDGTINAVADFNNDGRADLILSDSAYLTTSVRMNDGYGNFGNSITVSGSILSSSSMGGGMYSDFAEESKRTVADFNGDGRPDLITRDSSGQPYSGTLNIFDSSIFSGSSVVTPPSPIDTPSINHAPTGNVAILGTPTQAQTLTLKNTLADADGLGDFSYQWLSNGAEIFGATNASYVLSATDIGKKISVQVSYLDSEGTNELIASDMTTTVSGLAIATNGNDQITGTAKAEKIDGLAGNDILKGLEGNDTLIGGAGLDTLIGGAGADNLTGGSDSDVFKFTALADSGITSKNRDTITDFKHSEGDKIDLSAIDANEKLTGDQAFSFISSAAFSKTNATGQLRFDVTSKILYGSTDADIAPEFSIQLNGVSSLVASDFVL